ncbi:MAG: hypothetical protein ACREC1_05315 [Methylovirgula sp.]
MSFYVARYSPTDRVGPSGGLPDEDIEILEPSLEEALKMIEGGEIIDAKTIILLQTVKLAGLVEGK